MDDFSNDSEETALYTMTQATLSRTGKNSLTSTALSPVLNMLLTAGEIFHSYFSPSARRRATESRDKIEARHNIQAKLAAWQASVPDTMRYETGGKGHLALVLHMTYK